MSEKPQCDPESPAMPIHPNAVGTACGLTKRELIAAMTLQGFISADPEVVWKPICVAKISLEYADALIAELSKTGEKSDG